MPLHLVVSHSSQFYGQYATSFIALVVMVWNTLGNNVVDKPFPLAGGLCIVAI